MNQGHYFKSFRHVKTLSLTPQSVLGFSSFDSSFRAQIFGLREDGCCKTGTTFLAEGLQERMITYGATCGR